MNIDEYYQEFMQDILARSGAEENFTEAVFTERMCEFLVEQAVVENYTYASYRNTTRGIRVDAWDYNNETQTLSLFVTDFHAGKTLESLPRTEVTRAFKRVEKFFAECLTLNFLVGMEESAPGYELARLIYDRTSPISKVQFFLLSNAQLSSRVESVGKGEVAGYPCTHDVWDVSRVFRLETSGKAREDIVIDFKSLVRKGLPCLPAYAGSESPESYLLVMPGTLIADLYGKYGERLLEQNVRTFLQFRGMVNKGIRNTLQNEPEMFFAYNNGLTTTAERVETDDKREHIHSVTNFQIVNGGQTTASIFTAARKSKADLSEVYVQVKLTVIPAEKADDVVPKISQFANTQNKVSAADFFSNHPFHLRIEELSRRIWAPSASGGLRETHWFYERARGQYANAQANLTPAKQREFLLKNPRSQMFTKTDLAKFEYSFGMKPHIVSLGAQANFAAFASEIGQMWERSDTGFNELYFRHLIAKALLFRCLDRSVMRQSWYGGYKANIVTYSIAKLAHIVYMTGHHLNLDQIWRDQSPSAAIEAQLLTIAELVNSQIQDTPDNITNVTEWCKKEGCWQRIREARVAWVIDLQKELVEADEVDEKKKGAEKTQKIDDGIHSQTYVLGRGAEYWKQVRAYGLENALLSPKEIGITDVACQIPYKLPSEKQSDIILAVEKRVIEEGFFVPA
jgi:hypothetical protein